MRPSSNLVGRCTTWLRAEPNVLREARKTLSSNISSPLISIVTPTHNRRGPLLRAIQSVLSQTTTDFEYLIVDDASSDGTADAIRSLGDPRVKYLRLPDRLGANAARNAGIELSRSPIVTFLDSDDEFLPDRLANALSRFASEHGLSLMISSFLREKSKQSLLSVIGNRFLSASALERALITEAIAIGGSAITVRRDALLVAGSFNPEIRRFQDRDLLLRISRREGAYLSAKVDWIKHASHDSISRQRFGFVQSYGEFASAHRQVMQRHPEVAPYMVARRLLTNALRGRVLQALRDFGENRDHPALGYSATALVRGYVDGKKLRSKIRNELRTRENRSGNTERA